MISMLTAAVVMEMSSENWPMNCNRHRRLYLSRNITKYSFPFKWAKTRRYGCKLLAQRAKCCSLHPHKCQIQWKTRKVVIVVTGSSFETHNLCKITKSRCFQVKYEYFRWSFLVVCCFSTDYGLKGSSRLNRGVDMFADWIKGRISARHKRIYTDTHFSTFTRDCIEMQAWAHWHVAHLTAFCQWL